nr:hypothetical protein Iba_chr09dCG16300 [Ipomoea batatas]
MESEVDQRKTLEMSDEDPNRNSEKLADARPELESVCPNPINQESDQLGNQKTKETNTIVEQSVAEPIENLAEMEEIRDEETNPESSVNAKAEDMEEQELVDLKPALEMIAEMSGLKTKMRSDEYAVMSEEILEFARKIAREQSGNQTQERNENGESGSSSWQDEFSTEILEEMKGLCEVYARVKGGFNSKEETDEVMLRIIREMKNNGMRELKGKMKQEENDETLQTKGVKFAPAVEHHEENAGKNLETLNSENTIASDRGIPRVCENVPENKNAQLNEHFEEMTSKNNGVDPGTKGVPNVAPPRNQKMGKQLGDSGTAPGWGKNVNAGNNGGNASQGPTGNQWTAGPGPTMDKGRNQNKDKEGKQRGMNGRNGKQNNAPQRREAGKPYGPGTPGKQTGVSGHVGTFVRGEGSFRYQNYERGGVTAEGEVGDIKGGEAGEGTVE